MTSRRIGITLAVLVAGGLIGSDTWATHSTVPGLQSIGGANALVDRDHDTEQRIDASGNAMVSLGTALTSTSDSVTSVESKVSTASEAQVSCTSTSATLQASDTTRIEVFWLNQSPIEAFVCYAATCTTSAGMRFGENMGFVEKHYTGAITCITASGTATVAVKEN